MAREPSLALPRGHVAPKLIGLTARVTGARDGDLHDLLLEERDAEGAVQDAREDRMRGLDFLFPISTTEVRVHHAALDRTRAHDCDLDHEIVETFWTKARQHRHLSAALDLENTDRIGATNRFINHWIFRWNRRKTIDGRGLSREDRIVFHERERFANGGEHAEREHVDFEEPERVDVVLVPRDDGASLHRRGLDRGNLGQIARGEHEATDVHRQVAREALNLPCDGQDLHEAWIARVEPCLGEAERVDLGEAVPKRDDRAQTIDLLERKTEDLADLAQG